MRTVHWLFVVSVALFLGGIGFIIAAGRTAGDAPSIYDPVPTPVGTVKQVMKGIVGPAATVVFTSVGSTTTASGTEEKAPHTDEEWEAVGNSAIALAEAGNLLMMEGRAVDKGEWIKMSQAMIDAAKIALKATEAKSADDVLSSGDAINVSCDNCHRRYQRG
jgi:hypothetical protein